MPETVSQWRKDRCEWCAKGWPRAIASVWHQPPLWGTPMCTEALVECTAPKPEEYIAELSAERDERQTLSERVEKDLMDSFLHLFPRYAWTDGRPAIELMKAEITTCRVEREDARAALEAIKERLA